MNDHILPHGHIGGSEPSGAATPELPAEGDTEAAKLRQRIASYMVADETGEVVGAGLQEATYSREAETIQAAIADVLAAQTAWEHGDTSEGAPAVAARFLERHHDELPEADATALARQASLAKAEAREAQASEFAQARTANGAMLDAAHKLNLLHKELQASRRSGEAMAADRIEGWIREISQHLVNASRAHAEQSLPVYKRQQLVKQEETVGTRAAARPVRYEQVKPLQF